MELSDKIANTGIDSRAAKIISEIDFEKDRGVYAVHRDNLRKLDLHNIEYNNAIQVLNALWDGKEI